MKKFITIAAMAAFAVAGTVNVQAATLEEQIATLLAQISQLQGATTTTTSGSYVYQGGLLRVGSRGQQVRDLQTCLAELGNNPISNVDGVFGNITAQAVRNFQSQNGLMVDGIVGPETGPAYTAACATTVIVVVDDVDEEDDETPDVSGFDTNDGEEADFTDFDVEDADDDSIQEGQEEVDIAEVEFELEEGGAALLERFDILLDYTGGEAADEDDAWEVFDTIYLIVDGDVIAEIDADDEGDYEDRDTTANGNDGDDNRLRITGINHVFDAEEDHTIVIAADIAGSVDLGADDEAEWTLTVDQTSLRFVDEAGITVYLSEEDTSSEETAVFTIEDEGQEDELTVRESNDDPESSALEVEDDEKSDWYNIFTFEVDVDEDSQDLTFNDIFVTVETGSANVGDVVDDFELRIGSDTYDDWDFVGTTTGTTRQITFDTEDDDLIIDTDEEMDIELWAEFKAANGTNYSEGETVTASALTADVDAWDVEGGDDLDAGQLQGAANGETHTLLVDGAIVTLDSVTEGALSSSDTLTNNVLEATFKVNVEAFDETVYIAVDSLNAVIGDIVDASDDSSAGAVLGTDFTLSITSSAERVETTDSASYYQVSSDEDLTFKFTTISTSTVINPGDFYVEMTGLLFTSLEVTAITEAAAIAGSDTIVLDDDEFRSGVVTLLN
jgi:hypothetical protein